MEASAHSPSIFGRGLYSVPEAARLINVEPRTLQRWAAGYDFKGKNGAPRFSAPVIHKDLESRAGFVELTFLDLVEFLFISKFVKAGVSLYTVRRAAETAAELLGVKDHPFCVQGFKTDGKRIFAIMDLDPTSLAPAERRMLQLDNRQHVFVEVVEPFLRHFDYDVETQLVNRWWPLGKDRMVVVDPAINFGAPILAHSGVPVGSVVEFASGRKVDEVADWYEIPHQAVQDALSFEHRLNAA